MQGFNSPVSEVMKAETFYLGEGYVTGEMYDLGAYPGIIKIAEGRQIAGEVYEMESPEKLLAVLDDYEGCSENDASAEYTRGIAEIMVAGEVKEAWIYWLNPIFKNNNIITSGDYRSYSKSKKE